MQFSRHDKRLRGFIAGAVVLVLTMVCVLAWIHLDNERDRLNSILPGLRATASDMRRLSLEARRLRDVLSRNTHDSSVAGAFPAEVSQSAVASGLHGAVVTFLDSTRARVHFESVSFNDYFRWVEALQAKRGIRVESLRLESLNDPGIVTVDAVVFRP